MLGKDIASALQRILCGWHVFFRVYIGLREPFKRAVCLVLHKQKKGQRLQPAFLSDGGARTPLGPEGAVYILQLRHSSRGIKLYGKLIRKVALLAKRGDDFSAALFHTAQVLQALINFPQKLIVQGTGLFLAVPCDKGDGVAFVNQSKHVFTLGGLQMKFLTEDFADRHSMHPFMA